MNRNTFASLVVVLAVASTVGLSGCVLHARAATPGVAPPAPRYVEVDYRPGYVWVQGRWVWRYGDWHWQPGYYVADRPGYYWAPGYWDTRGGSYVWIDGSWSRGSRPSHVRYHYSYKNRGRVYQRDHRRSNPRVYQRDHRSQPSVRTRDHRAPQPSVRTRDHRAPARSRQKVKSKSSKETKTRVIRRDHRDD